MGGSLFLAIVVQVVALYAPGYFFIRSLRIPRIVCLACAPLVTLAAYSILTFLYWKMGIFCTGGMLVIPVVVLGLGCFGLSTFFAKRKGDVGVGDFSAAAASSIQGWIGLLLYVVVGVLVTIGTLLLNMESPDSFIQYYDNLHHLGTIYGFVASGNWSSFDSSLYPLPVDSAISPAPDGSFYPSAWHGIAAISVSVLGVSAPMAQNAAVVVFCAFVYPMAMFLLLRHLFRHKPSAIFFGAFIAMGFALFPWRLVTFGPLFPNLASFALIPASMYCFIFLFEDGLAWRQRVSIGVLFLSGLVSVAFVQPNAIFAAAALLAPFCVLQAGRLANLFSCSESVRRTLRVGLFVVSAALIGIIWFACFKLPFMQGIVSYNWPSETSVLAAVVDIATLDFISLPSQLVMGVAVAVGVLLVLLRHREYSWLVCSYALVSFMYVVDVSTDGFLKHLLTGFWYTDPYRVAACAVMAMVPLASFGLGSLSDCALSFCQKKLAGRGESRIRFVVPGLLIFVFACMNFWPHYLVTGAVDDRNAFDVAGKYMREGFFNSEYGYYGTDERAFVKRALDAMPEDALVINVPNDGSAFAYSADGLRVYYRYFDMGSGESEASCVIREGLCDVTSRADVRAAVEGIGAGYVLQLDADSSDQRGVYEYWFDRDTWRGILSINDATPGFEVVLSEGDMRLYRITAG